MFITGEQFDVFTETMEKKVTMIEANEEVVKVYLYREKEDEKEVIRFWSDGSVERRLSGQGNVSNFYDIIEVEEVV